MPLATQKAIIVAAVVIVLTPLAAHAGARRSASVGRQFEREHPCPSTGLTYGACPGYVKDHLMPLCAGGADAVENLAWEEVAESRAKDVEEDRLCQLMRMRQIRADIDRAGLCRELSPAQWPLLTKALCG
jgi:hypothetical protein